MALSTKERIFAYTRIDLSNSSLLYVVNIEAISSKLRSHLDQSLGQLAYGRKNMELSRVKRKILKFLAAKSGSHQESGSIAEFFVHLFLHYRGLKPLFIIDNLEENALKKGFDGYYIDKSNTEWICESKSGSMMSENMSHVKKVKEAYKDLKNKLAGKANNNPWQNAARHAKQVDANLPLVEQLQEISDNYDDGIYLEIKECHIIPSGTVYIDGPWQEFDDTEIAADIEIAIKRFECKGMRILCITKKSMDAFYDYLNT